MEKHTPVTVRGRSGYLFPSIRGEGAHSVMWREDCRWMTVDARLPAEAVLATAEELPPPVPGVRKKAASRETALLPAGRVLPET